jgi:hypothetical protein
MPLILLIAGGVLVACALLGLALGGLQHKLTAPTPRAPSAPAKAMSPALASTPSEGEVDVGSPPHTAAPALQEVADTERRQNSHEPSLAQNLAMEHVNS